MVRAHSQMQQVLFTKSDCNASSQNTWIGKIETDNVYDDTHVYEDEDNSFVDDFISRTMMSPEAAFWRSSD